MVRLRPFIVLIVKAILRSCLVALACLSAARAERVVFHFDWFAGAQFAGIYAAEAQSFYREAGLTIESRPFAFGLKPIEDMAAVDVCSIGAIEGYIFVQKRAQGNDIRAAAAMLQESPAGYMMLATTDIHGVTDFPGHRIGVHTFADPLFRWFMRRRNLDPQDADMRFTGDDVTQLTTGQLDAMQGYATEEYVQLRARAPGDTRFLSFAELGFPSYSEVLYTTANQAERHPATIRAFVEATRRGWTYVFEHLNEATALVAAHVGEQADLAHIRASLGALQTFVRPDGQEPLAPMTSQKWDAMQAACLEMGLIKNAEPATQFLLQPAP